MKNKIILLTLIALTLGTFPGLAQWTGPNSVTDADAATLDATYDTSALSTGKPTGACDRALRTTLTGVAGYDSVQFDRGSAISAGTSVDVRFYVYVQTAVSGVSRIAIFAAGQNPNPAGGLSFSVEMQNDSGTSQIRAGAVTDSAWINLTANSWNLVHVHVDANNASSTVAVNGGSAQGFTSSATAGIRYVYAGACAAGASASAVWVTDLIAVNTP